MSAMKNQYGDKKAEQVFYASRNKGTIKGVDKKRKVGNYEHSIVKKALQMRGEP